MPHVCTIQARATQKILSAAAEAGVEPGEVLHAVQINPVLLASPERRIPYARYVAMGKYAADRTGDDDFGLHVAEGALARMFDVLGYACMASLTVGEALERMVRYYEIWSDGGAYGLRAEGSRVHLTYAIRDSLVRECRHECEMSFATPVLLCRQMTGTRLVPEVVGFHHPPPGNSSEHERIFRAPVRFNWPVNELVFDRSYLELPLAGGDPGLADVLDRHAERLLAELPKPEWLADRVRGLLGERLKGGHPLPEEVSLETVSRQLGLTGRTLQRRLKEEGASFQGLVDELRREAAMSDLKSPGAAISEIAYRLGFSDPSAFHRAFKRWTGTTPKEYRHSPR